MTRAKKPLSCGETRFRRMRRDKPPPCFRVWLHSRSNMWVLQYARLCPAPAPAPAPAPSSGRESHKAAESVPTLFPSAFPPRLVGAPLIARPRRHVPDPPLRPREMLSSQVPSLRPQKKKGHSGLRPRPGSRRCSRRRPCSGMHRNGYNNRRDNRLSRPRTRHDNIQAKGRSRCMQSARQRVECTRQHSSQPRPGQNLAGHRGCRGRLTFRVSRPLALHAEATPRVGAFLLACNPRQPAGRHGRVVQGDYGGGKGALVSRWRASFHTASTTSSSEVATVSPVTPRQTPTSNR